jgi:hypothetical protein
MVENDPVGRWDWLGFAKCCVGNRSVKYDPARQCCKDDTLFDRYKICIRASAGRMKGHSWISTVNLNTGEEHTYGTRRGSHAPLADDEYKGHSGLHIDYELREGRVGTSVRCKTICGFSEPEDPGYGIMGLHWFNNCTTFAMNVWKDHTGEDLDSGPDSPKILAETIDANNKYDETISAILEGALNGLLEAALKR